MNSYQTVSVMCKGLNKLDLIFYFYFGQDPSLHIFLFLLQVRPRPCLFRWAGPGVHISLFWARLRLGLFFLFCFGLGWTMIATPMGKIVTKLLV